MTVRNISASFYAFYGMKGPDTGTQGQAQVSGLAPNNEFDVYELNSFDKVLAEGLEKGIEEEKLAVISNGKQLSTLESLSFVRTMATNQITPIVQAKKDLEALNPAEGDFVFVAEFNSSFKYSNVLGWQQSAEETIYRSGLISGVLYTDTAKIG